MTNITKLERSKWLNDNKFDGVFLLWQLNATSEINLAGYLIFETIIHFQQVNISMTGVL